MTRTQRDSPGRNDGRLGGRGPHTQHPASRNTPTTYGKAGGSLGKGADTSWAVNDAVAAVGAKGEQMTGEIMASLPSGLAVFHDLRVPGSRANIDHAVVDGNNLYLIDSKWWKGGFYWTLGGKTRRGTERFKPAEKETMVVAAQRISDLLTGQGVDFVLHESLIVVWSRDKINLRFAQMPGAKFVPGPMFQRKAKSMFGKGKTPPDAQLVREMKRLVI